jgi:hypothetical protein
VESELLTNHWREIFDPAAQIFLNSTVNLQGRYMIEIIKIYPMIFIFTVIVPLLGGLVGSYIGWDSLKSRHSDSLHQKELKTSLKNIDSRLEPITDQIAILQRYEKELSKHNQKDDVLSAVLSQYIKMKSATENFQKFRGTDNQEEQSKLAEHILATISNNVVPIVEAKNLPSQPLIIQLAHNTYKVIFSVPMRIAPELVFNGIPDDVKVEVSERSKFGFIVHFIPYETTITQFGFTANAEL